MTDEEMCKADGCHKEKERVFDGYCERCSAVFSDGYSDGYDDASGFDLWDVENAGEVLIYTGTVTVCAIRGYRSLIQ